MTTTSSTVNGPKLRVVDPTEHPTLSLPGIGFHREATVVPSRVVVVSEPIKTSPTLRAALDPELLSRVLDLLADGDVLKGAGPVNRRVLLTGGGVPNADATGFLAENASLSAATIRAVASDVKLWVDWCLERRVDPSKASRAQIRLYRDHRVNSAATTTWNRQRSTLSAFFADLHSRGIRNDNPLEGNQLTVTTGESPLRGIDDDGFRLFRDVGLRGLDLDGALDPTFRGGAPERNGLYADLLVTTGMRRQEAGALLLLDLPARKAGQVLHHGRLPQEICKGRRGRRYRVTEFLMRRLDTYHAGEWQDLVQRAQPALKRSRESLKIVTDFDATRVRIDGRWIRRDRLSIEDRACLATTTEVSNRLALPCRADWLVPLQVFPGTRGRALTTDSWTRIFSVASERVSALHRTVGLTPPMPVSPHVLRHTFALRFMEEKWRALKEHSPMTGNAKKAYMVANPLMELAELLGHASEQTSKRYLRAVIYDDPLADSNFSTWVEALISTWGDSDD